MRSSGTAPNELPREKGAGLVVVFLRQLAQPVMYLLLGAAGVTAAVAHWIDAGVILGIVVANAVIGVVQERRAGQAIELCSTSSLTRRPLSAPASRGGSTRATLVPGDVVVLDAGDKVPADCRLLDASGLFVDEAQLTGESVPVEKLEAGSLPAETPLPERRNRSTPARWSRPGRVVRSWSRPPG